MSNYSIKMKNSKVKAIAMSILFIIVFTSTLAIAPTEVYACDCAIPVSAAEEMERSTAVFSGKVIKITDANKFKPVKSSADPMVVTMTVNEAWKGINQTQIQVQTARESASCGIQYQTNEQYLVFARATGDELLSTNICDGTKLLSHASNDLAELGSGTIPTEHVDLLNSKSEKVFVAMFAVFAIVIIIAVWMWGRNIAKRSQ